MVGSRPSVDIRGVMVSLKDRDVRLVTDTEHEELRSLVEDEQRYEKGKLLSIHVESPNFAGTVRFRSSTREEMTDGTS